MTKKEFEARVAEVCADYKNANLETRKEVVNDLCEQYVMLHDKKPDSYQLQMLADLLLKEDLSNNSPYKAQEIEYGFHSNTQRKRRKKKEFVAEDDTLDHMHYKKKVNLSTAPPKDIIKL